MDELESLITRLDQYRSATTLRTAARRDAMSALESARSHLTSAEAIEIEHALVGG